MKTNNSVGQLVLETVGEHFGMQPAEIQMGLGEARMPRRLVVHVMNEIGEPDPEIKKWSGFKTQVSIDSSLDKVKKSMKKDKEMEGTVKGIVEKVLSQTEHETHRDSNGGNGGSIDLGETRNHDGVSMESAVQAVKDAGRGISQARHRMIHPFQIEDVHLAVSGVMINAAHIVKFAEKAAAEAILARDTVIYYLWKYCPQVPRSDVLDFFKLGVEAFNTAIGRVTVCLEDSSFGMTEKLAKIKKKLSDSKK